MKRFLIALTVGSAATLALATPASAQAWQSINQRQANLDARIDAGVRSGSLTRNEAIVLRGEFRTLANLEANYRRGGLSGWERQDLNRRFDLLSARVYGQKHDDQHGGRWQTINQRQQNLDARIDVGVRQGAISRREAILLRGEFRTIADLEANYRRNGLNNWERQDLDRRFDRLSAKIRVERNDGPRRL